MRGGRRGAVEADCLALRTRASARHSATRRPTTAKPRNAPRHAPRPTRMRARSPFRERVREARPVPEPPQECRPRWSRPPKAELGLVVALQAILVAPVAPAPRTMRAALRLPSWRRASISLVGALRPGPPLALPLDASLSPFADAGRAVHPLPKRRRRCHRVARRLASQLARWQHQSLGGRALPRSMPSYPHHKPCCQPCCRLRHPSLRHQRDCDRRRHHRRRHHRRRHRRREESSSPWRRHQL
jgi:hypothetical protein